VRTANGLASASNLSAARAAGDPATPTIKSVADATRAATLSVASAAANDLPAVTQPGSHDSTLPSAARVALIVLVAIALLGVLLGPRLPFLQGAEDEFELAGKNPLLQRLRRRQRGVVIAPGGNSGFHRASNPH
jgi:hypothetical protein